MFSQLRKRWQYVFIDGIWLSIQTVVFCLFTSATPYINDETVFHVAFEQALIGFVDLLTPKIKRLQIFRSSAELIVTKIVDETGGCRNAATCRSANFCNK